MIFKIVNGYEKNSEFLITGRLVPTSEDEVEGLAVMVDVFKDIPTFSGKFASNDKTLLFKSVEVNLLKQMLDYLSRELEVDFKYQIAKNFAPEYKVEEILNAEQSK